MLSITTTHPKVLTTKILSRTRLLTTVSARFKSTNANANAEDKDVHDLLIETKNINKGIQNLLKKAVEGNKSIRKEVVNGNKDVTHLNKGIQGLLKETVDGNKSLRETHKGVQNLLKETIDGNKSIRKEVINGNRDVVNLNNGVQKLLKETADGNKSLHETNKSFQDFLKQVADRNQDIRKRNQELNKGIQDLLKQVIEENQEFCKQVVERNKKSLDTVVDTVAVGNQKIVDSIKDLKQSWKDQNRNNWKGRVPKGILRPVAVIGVTIAAGYIILKFLERDIKTIHTIEENSKRFEMKNMDEIKKFTSTCFKAQQEELANFLEDTHNKSCVVVQGTDGSGKSWVVDAVVHDWVNKTAKADEKSVNPRVVIHVETDGYQSDVGLAIAFETALGYKVPAVSSIRRNRFNNYTNATATGVQKILFLLEIVEEFAKAAKLKGKDIVLLIDDLKDIDVDSKAFKLIKNKMQLWGNTGLLRPIVVSSSPQAAHLFKSGSCDSITRLSIVINEFMKISEVETYLKQSLGLDLSEQQLEKLKETIGFNATDLKNFIDKFWNSLVDDEAQKVNEKFEKTLEELHNKKTRALYKSLANMVAAHFSHRESFENVFREIIQYNKNYNKNPAKYENAIFFADDEIEYEILNLLVENNFVKSAAIPLFESSTHQCVIDKYLTKRNPSYFSFL